MMRQKEAGNFAFAFFPLLFRSLGNSSLGFNVFVLSFFFSFFLQQFLAARIQAINFQTSELWRDVWNCVFFISIIHELAILSPSTALLLYLLTSTPPTKIFFSKTVYHHPGGLFYALGWKSLCIYPAILFLYFYKYCFSLKKKFTKRITQKCTQGGALGLWFVLFASKHLYGVIHNILPFFKKKILYLIIVIRKKKA